MSFFHYITPVLALCLLVLPARAGAQQVPDGFAVYSKGDTFNRTLHMVTLKPGMTQAQIAASEKKLVNKGPHGGDIQGQISFDGKWLAFSRSEPCSSDALDGNDYHKFECWSVHIIKLHGPLPATPIKIAGKGAYWPSWGDDSDGATKTLYYSQSTGKNNSTLRAVTVSASGGLSNDRQVADIFKRWPDGTDGIKHERFVMAAPNGTFVAARWSGAVYAAHLSGPLAGKRFKLNGGCMPAICADSEWVIHANNKRGRYDGKSTGAVQGDGSGDYHYGSSPDMKWFTARTEGNWQKQNTGFDVHLMTLQASASSFVTKRQVLLTNKGSWPDVHAWAPGTAAPDPGTEPPPDPQPEPPPPDPQPEPQPPTGNTLRINCGDNKHTAPGWQNDDAFVEGGGDWTNPNTIDTAGVADAAPEAVYRSVRHQTPHAYRLPVADGDYTLKIHFADAYGDRSMRYVAEGQVLIDGLDIVSEAGGKNIALVKSFSVTVTGGDGLLLEANGDDDVFEAGIELHPAGGGTTEPGGETPPEDLLPSITILSPVAGDKLEVGSTHIIRWTTKNLSDVGILYSVDGGASFESITQSVDDGLPEWQAYPWTVPDQLTDKAQIQIMGYFGEAPTESATFAIVPVGQGQVANPQIPEEAPPAANAADIGPSLAGGCSVTRPPGRAPLWLLVLGLLAWRTRRRVHGSTRQR